MISFGEKMQRRTKVAHNEHYIDILVPVTVRSEDAGLVYPLSVAWWVEIYKFSTKGCFYFEEQRAIAEKTNIVNFR